MTDTPNTPELSTCPICAAIPDVDQNGFVSCPTVFEPEGKSCPVYGENAEMWGRVCEAAIATRTPPQAPDGQAQLKAKAFRAEVNRAFIYARDARPAGYETAIQAIERTLEDALRALTQEAKSDD